MATSYIPSSPLGEAGRGLKPYNHEDRHNRRTGRGVVGRPARRQKLGGAPANFAYHTRQFGFNSVAVSAVGEKKLGDETLAALDEKGLEYDMARVPYPTGTVQVTLDEEGIPTYDIRENVAWDNIPFTPELEEPGPQLPCSVLRVAGPKERGFA